jgi:hypothetical protein
VHQARVLSVLLAGKHAREYIRKHLQRFSINHVANTVTGIVLGLPREVRIAVEDAINDFRLLRWRAISTEHS